MKLSEQIIHQARGWLGTRFSHQGRRKITSHNNGGVDCLGLLLGVASELELTDRQNNLFNISENISYSKIPNSQELLRGLRLRLYEIDCKSIRAGDIALLEIDSNPQHLAIISGYSVNSYGMIHAYAPSRKVIEHRFDDIWRKRVVAAFSFYAPSNS